MTRFIVDIEDPKKIEYFIELMNKNGFKYSQQEDDFDLKNNKLKKNFEEVLFIDNGLLKKLAK